MTIKRIWTNRVVNKRKRLSERSTISQTGIMMPHWIRYQPRKAESLSAATLKRTVSHLIKPEMDPFESPLYTVCDWHLASFRALPMRAQQLKVKRHKLTTPATNTFDDFVYASHTVSCSYCFDVLDSIASWRELNRGGFAATTPLTAKGFNLVHMCWPDSDKVCTPVRAQRWTSDTVFRPTQFKQLVGHNREAEGDEFKHNLCVTCCSVFEVLWGNQRPHCIYTRYEQMEDALADLESHHA